MISVTETNRNYLLTFREEVGPGAVLSDVEVLPQFAAGFKSEHGVIVQAVVPEQDDASGLQHLKNTQMSHNIIKLPNNKHILLVFPSFLKHLVSLCSHPADVLQRQLHLVWMDGRHDEDERDDVHAALWHIIPQVVFG